LAELGVEDHRQKAGSGPAAGDDVEGGRRLGDLLAGAAGELLPDGLNDLPLPGDHLQRLRHIFAEFAQDTATARASGRSRQDDALARQMRRQRRPHRLATGEAAHHRVVLGGFGGRDLGGDLVLRRRRLELFQLQLQLVEDLAAALGRWPEAVPLHLGDDQLQMLDHRLGARGAGFCHLAGRALGGQRRLQGFDVVGEYLEACRHTRN
jgi:hypothetical protein